MKLIITENQQENLIKQLVKSSGFKIASRVIGDPEMVAEKGFNNDYTEFMKLFDNMEVRKLKSTQWVYSLGYLNIMILNKRKKEIFINYTDFGGILMDVFNIPKEEVRMLLHKWLLDTYKIKVDKIHINPISQSL